MRGGKFVLAVMMALALAACATNKAFEEGKKLIAEGNLDMGLESLERAAREEPGNLQIRAVLARQREAVANRLLAEGENARALGNLEAAEEKYRHVLRLNPRNERAQAGLDAIERDRRHAEELEKAHALLESGDYSAAETAIWSVLRESPLQPDARRLMKLISDHELQRGDLEQPVLKTGFKQPITLEFRDTGLKSVFEIMARTSGINFVFDKDVKQDSKTSVYLRNTHVEDVLKLLLLTNQLAYKVLNENSVLIYPNTPAKQKEYQELVVRSFYVSNVDVKQMVTMVKGVVKTKDIHVDEKLNLFVMKDTPAAIRLVERLVALNDLADPEVMLEVEVLEIGRNKILNLGIQYPDKMNVSMLNAASTTIGAPPPDMFEISSSGINRSGSNLDRLTGFIANPAMIVNLKKTDGIINVLANPRIRVKNREKAKILIGDKVPVVTTTATANVGVASSVSYLEVGLKLDVESIVSLQDEVTMKVGLEVSNIVKEVPVAGGGLAYQVGTRTTETTLALRDGETQILAGLINDDERTTFTKVPGLGDLPWIGRLFLSESRIRNKTEIALLITPRIVRNISRRGKSESEFHFGTENTVGPLPVTIGKVAPRSLAMSSRPGAVTLSGRESLAAARESRMASDESGSAPAPAPQEVGPSLFLNVPEQAAPGKDFSVSVGLTGAGSLPAAEFELGYDATQLETLDPSGTPGSRQLKLGKGGGAVDVRFRVIAQKPGTAEVSVRNLTLQAEAGESPPEVTLPPPVSIEIR